MSHPPIIDAGPSLNFLSINKERLLIGVLGRLSAPEAVQTEVLRKSRQDHRFRSAEPIWRKLAPSWIRVLSDDQTPELAAVITRITQQPMSERLRHSKDLGETMVIAHAVVAAEAGNNLLVLIDDGLGGETRHSRKAPAGQASLHGPRGRLHRIGKYADGTGTRRRRCAHTHQGHDAQYLPAATRPRRWSTADRADQAPINDPLEKRRIGTSRSCTDTDAPQ